MTVGTGVASYLFLDSLEGGSQAFSVAYEEPKEDPS